MRTLFTSEQIAQMKTHPCVWRVTERSIHYTYDFKKRALDLYAQGIKPDDIWRQAGFEVSIWKKNYCRYTLKDWRRLVKRGGLESLTNPSGSPVHGFLHRYHLCTISRRFSLPFGD